MGNLCCPENEDKEKNSSSLQDLNINQKEKSDPKSHYDENKLKVNEQRKKVDIKPISEKRIVKRNKPIVRSHSLEVNNKTEQQVEDKPYLVLIGAAGVEEQKLIQQMKLTKMQSLKSRNSLQLINTKESQLKEESQFKEEILRGQYVIVYTPSSFQMDDDIGTREKVIKEFQEYFEKRKFISSFGIVVNFERTDLMKKKVLSALKYLRKFIEIISIIVVNMELSDNQDEDKDHLRTSFKFMGYNQIIFINKNMKQQEILEQIRQITFSETQIDLTNTIFQRTNVIDEHRIYQELIPQNLKHQERY